MAARQDGGPALGVVFLGVLQGWLEVLHHGLGVLQGGLEVLQGGLGVLQGGLGPQTWRRDKMAASRWHLVFLGGFQGRLGVLRWLEVLQGGLGVLQGGLGVLQGG